MKTLMLASLFMVFLFCRPRQAQTAEEMVSSCKALASAKVTGDLVAAPRDFDSGVCWGAFEMVQEMTQIVHSEKDVYGPIFHICAPIGSTTTQFIKIFEQYATNHPERLHEDFWIVAQAGLREVFPCKT